MGTSSSFRSPNIPRWRAFNRALESGQPLERLRAQLFVAGEASWLEALAAPALASFAERLLEAHRAMHVELEATGRPDAVIAAVVRQARDDAFAEDFTPATGLAERALRAVLLEAVRGQGSVIGLDAPTAAANWEIGRGSRGELLSRFLAELLGQWAAHVVSRDAARLVGAEGLSTRELRTLTDDVRGAAMAAATEGRFTGIDEENVGSQWHSLVTQSFDRGRRMRRDDAP